MSKGVHVMGGGQEVNASSPSKLILDVGVDSDGVVRDRSNTSPISFVRTVSPDTYDGVRCVDIHEGAIKIDKPHEIRKAWIGGNLRVQCRFAIYQPTPQNIIFGSCYGGDKNCPMTIYSYFPRGASGNMYFIYNTNWDTMTTIKTGVVNGKWNSFEIVMRNFSIDVYFNGSLVTSGLDNYSNHGVVRDYDVLIGDKSSNIGPAGHRFGYIEYFRIYNDSYY